MISYSVSSQILNGSATADGTLLTIPAGKRWCGQIQLSGCISVAGTATSRVTTSGTGVTPTTGAVLARISLTGLALTTVGTSTTISAIVVAGTTDATLVFAVSGASSASAVANGILV